ncbi:MAG TPA: GDSL-type esterase/lipase family protein [Candidatus Bathyarchaeia archaeon]|nr:GDSL-type esterase/lipase family protein [Candidatus Bathyarchaeia archaeon]
MKIVALGDSLTVGENEFDISDSGQPTSYPEYLEMIAEEHLRSLKSDVKVDVLNKGISGDLTLGMLERFSKDVVDEKADYVIILGGTNDIGWGFDSAMIVHNLTTMYDTARKKDIVAVACSVPSILGFDEFIPPRLHLNRMIRTETDKRSMPFVDLFTATADPRNNRLSEGYSADGLHLNTEGYQQISKYIFDKWLRPLLDQRLRKSM